MTASEPSFPPQSVPEETSSDELTPGRRTMRCELCECEIDFDASRCSHCKAQRKDCPYCGLPLWHGVDECPHCGAHKPNPGTWSIL